MTRRYVEALLQHQEREVFMAGLWHITGYDQVAQMVRKLSNAESTYTFRRKVSLFVNSITSFSNTPLIGIFYLGLGISLLAVLYVFGYSYIGFSSTDRQRVGLPLWRQSG